MQFAFSTVGCPQWSWAEVLAAAKDLGYDGVEVRGIGRHIDLPKAKELSGAGLAGTLAMLSRTGLRIPCLASSCYLHIDGTGDARQAEIRAYVDLAATLGTPFVRVLGDTNPEPGVGHEALPMVKDALLLAAPYAAERGVTLLLETNGLLSDSSVMADLMAECAGPAVAVLWDFHHPFRYHGEAPEITWSRLSRYVRHIHAKDSRMADGGLRYTLVGQGDVPVARVFRLLSDVRYEGWVTLEWVKRSIPDLEEPELVFPHFIDFARSPMA